MDKFLVDQTSAVTGESKEFVATCIGGISSFIKEEIASGQFRNVRIPLFGIFKVDVKKIAGINTNRAKPKPIIKKGA